MDGPYLNTDRELFREDTADPAGSYYENSIHVTSDGRIGMAVGGTVYVKPIAEWHDLAGGVITGPLGDGRRLSSASPQIPAGPWRVGARCPRNLYIEDGSGPDGRGRDVGRMDTPELAAYVVEAVNLRQQSEDAAGDLYQRTLREQVDRMEGEIHRLRLALVVAAEPGRSLEDVRADARTALAVPRG